MQGWHADRCLLPNRKAGLAATQGRQSAHCSCWPRQDSRIRCEFCGRRSSVPQQHGDEPSGESALLHATRPALQVSQ